MTRATRAQTEQTEQTTATSRGPIRRAMTATALSLLLAATVPAAPTSAAEPTASPYIVVFQDSVERPQALAREHARTHRAEVAFTYSSALKGYAARLDRRAYADIVSDPRVAYVEPDGVVHTTDTQPNATWGLDRIDQANLPLNGNYSYMSTGAGVTAYIIDTGIDAGHVEFGDRAKPGFDAITSNGTADDCNGHGTHVAGTMGGTTYGVAKQVSLVAVRVLGCSGSGTTSQVIAGVDWVTGNHQPGAPAVANMSLSSSGSRAMDNAVRSSIADGVTYAIAAGNGNVFGIAQDACKYSPSRVTEALTISATTASDGKASFANYGNCVDWFAPGMNITSAANGPSNNETAVKSGTSMAAPHTAGVAALYLQGQAAASPATVRAALFALTTKDVVTGSSTANDHLLFTSY